MPAVAITIQDIIDAIDSEPEMLEALRARLLSRELLELPERFAEFQANTQEFQANTQEFQANTLEFQANMREFQSNTLEFQANTQEFQANTREFQANTREFQKSTLEFQANAEKRFVGLETDVGTLKGWMASENGLKEIPFIAYSMGYEYSRLLERVELIRMARGSDASGISRGELVSFMHADAVAEVTDEEGRARYIAVEFSFTAHKRDVDRAVRNAEYITRFTDAPASAAVAGFRMDSEIQDAVDSGDVFWHELPASIMQAE